MKIVFLRHGQAEHNLPSWQGGINTDNACLTPAGQQAAAKAGQELSQFNFTAAYASPMLRTQQTAQIALKSQKSPLKLETDPRLRDVYVSHQLSKHWRLWQKLWRLRLDLHPKTKDKHLAQHKLVEGKSLGETIGPIADFLADMQRRQARGPVLVVGHLHTFWALTHATGNEPLTTILQADSFLPPANWREIGV